MNRNWCNQKANPAFTTRRGNDQKSHKDKNTMRTIGQPNGQLFPKRWSLSNPNRTKSILNKHNVKHHLNSDTKNRQKITLSEPPPWNVQ